LDHFLEHHNRIQGRRIVGFTRPALKILLNHEYPGNVRELQNIIEHAFILCKTSHIGSECLPKYLEQSPYRKKGKSLMAVKVFERDLIVETLQKHCGKIKAAAEEMGIHRSTLWRKIRKLNISLDK
jgi:transcriptional regulator with PAS, ATPase and Fis domain